MKKIFKSRGFIISTLAVICIVILGISWYANRERTEAFVPDESPPSTQSSQWAENSTEQEPETEDITKSESMQAKPLPPSTTAAKTEEYPKVAEKTPEETVISFTPAKKTEETAPSAPEGKTILEDPGPEHPINLAPETTAPAETPAATEPPITEPAATEPPATQPESTQPAGAVYDPVFGWVVPSEVIQSTISSDGDPNKMVGNMD